MSEQKRKRVSPEAELACMTGFALRTSEMEALEAAVVRERMETGQPVTKSSWLRSRFLEWISAAR